MTAGSREPTLLEQRLAFAIFLAGLVFHFWGVGGGWSSRNLPGGEFRQAQTALSAYWIRHDNDFTLAYPTPVMGKPWSIPMEFPLYQWTVVVTGKLTGWGLTKSGRAVSIACFYLCLPAIFLLLGRWRVAPGWRWLMLAVVLTCPFYIYYSRAFLIETMALMFALWFWVGFERAVASRHRGWLAVAILAGSGAGLVKVTTFLLYWVPVGAWAASRLWQERRGTWRADLGWMLAIMLPATAMATWWTRFADATKELNVLGRDITSAGLRDFNLGTTASRFSLELWAAKVRIVATELTWWPLLLLGAGVAFWLGRARRRGIAGMLACFAAALVLFPALYAYHSYYYVANTVLLLLALGLVLVALAESHRRWVAAVAVLVVLGGQAWRYLEFYRPGQTAISAGGDGLTRSLQALTQPEDIIVVLGQDWNSMLPYYAQRRALMIRDDVAREPARVEQALAALAGEKIGAVVVTGQPPGREWLVERAGLRGVAPQPLFVRGQAQVYVPADRRDALLHALLQNSWEGVTLAPGVKLPSVDVVARWCDYAGLPAWQRAPFDLLTPKPVRFFCTFGPGLDVTTGRVLFGAHPVTRLVFALPPGRHVLRTELELPPETYHADLPAVDMTDGVEVSLFALGSGDDRRLLATRHFDPRGNPEDRGTGRPLQFEFELLAAGEVELFLGPGPQGRDTRDWLRMGPLRID